MYLCIEQNFSYPKCVSHIQKPFTHTFTYRSLQFTKSFLWSHTLTTVYLCFTIDNTLYFSKFWNKLCLKMKYVTEIIWIYVDSKILLIILVVVHIFQLSCCFSLIAMELIILESKNTGKQDDKQIYKVIMYKMTLTDLHFHNFSKQKCKQSK